MFSEFLQPQGLSIERLHALVQLSETGSLIRAAGGDSGRQSRYSHYLRELSAFFGTALTEKAGKNLRLSPAGEELAKIAREQLRTLQNFQRSVNINTHEWCIGAADSLLQWFLIPALGKLRRPGRRNHYVLSNLRTAEIAHRVQDQSLDFGLLRSDAVPLNAVAEEICVMRFVVVVPRRLTPQRGYLSLKKALLDCPHAAMAGGGQMAQRLTSLAQRHGGIFRAELVCDSVEQCLSAVRTGSYAAVLPAHAVEPEVARDCVVVDEELEELDRSISLAWYPRTIDVLGAPAESVRCEVRDALLDEAAQRGMGKSSPDKISR